MVLEFKYIRTLHIKMEVKIYSISDSREIATGFCMVLKSRIIIYFEDISVFIICNQYD